MVNYRDTEVRWHGGFFIARIRFFIKVSRYKPQTISINVQSPDRKRIQLGAHDSESEDGYIAIYTDLPINLINKVGEYQIFITLQSENFVYSTESQSLYMYKTVQLEYCLNCRYLKNYSICRIFNYDISTVFANMDKVIEDRKHKEYYPILKEMRKKCHCPISKLDLIIAHVIEDDLEVFPTIETKIGELML